MKIVNTIPHYTKYGYKTYVVDNYVFDEPSDSQEILKGEYVYKKGKLFKALKDTISKDENLGNTDIFVEISVYSDETPKDKVSKVSKEEKVNEISKIVQKSETTKDEKVEIAKDSQDEKIDQTEQSVQKVNNFKTKKKR